MRRFLLTPKTLLFSRFLHLFDAKDRQLTGTNMATAKIYLDKRKAKADGTFPLRITISHRGNTAHMTLGIAIRADQWNAATSKVTNHPNKGFLNPFLL